MTDQAIDQTNNHQLAYCLEGICSFNLKINAAVVCWLARVCIRLWTVCGLARVSRAAYVRACVGACMHALAGAAPLPLVLGTRRSSSRPQHAPLLLSSLKHTAPPLVLDILHSLDMRSSRPVTP